MHLALGDTRLFLTAPRMLDDPTADVPPILGLLDLSPLRFGLAQVDVDGGDAQGDHPGGDLVPAAGPEPRLERRARRCGAPRGLRPGGDPSGAAVGRSLSLRGRARAPAAGLVAQSKAFNDALEEDGSQPRPFFAEDLVRGYRLDVWDSHTNDWHSLHFRDATYMVENGPTQAIRRRGGLRPARGHAARSGRGACERRPVPPRGDRSLGGWSLAVEMPGKPISRFADPERRRPTRRPGPESTNEPVTPFKLTTSFGVVEGRCPAYASAGAIACAPARSTSRAAGSRWATTLPTCSPSCSRCRAIPKGFAVPPLRAGRRAAGGDSRRVGGDGRRIRGRPPRHQDEERRSSEGRDPPISRAQDRHMLPPRTSVELGERLGMFDTSDREAARRTPRPGTSSPSGTPPS